MTDSQLLQKYLFLYKSIPLEGLGTLYFQPAGAQLDFPNRQLNPPKAELFFSQQVQPASHLYLWMAGELKTTPFEARDLVQQFTGSILTRLKKQNKVDWPLLGTFQKEANDTLQFTSDWMPVAVAAPVKAERVIRSGASHSIRVGEDIRTNVEMEELITSLNKKTRTYWWMAALLLFLAAAAAIVVFVRTHKEHWYRQSNYHLIETKDAPLPYKKA
jgi:hypothetical protein